MMIERPKVALVLRAWLEENLHFLHSLAKFKRYNAQWHVFVDDQARGAEDPDWLLDQGWDGIICKESSDELYRKARERGIACVDLSDDGTLREGCPKIRPNNPSIGHLGAEHFVEKGFKHYAFCGFGNERWSNERRDGFVEALELAGKDCELFETDYPGVSMPAWEFAEEGEMARWLDTLPKPVAIMACNDLRAVHLVNACHQADLRVPEEVAILGSNNDVARCELCAPSLSSIPVDVSEYARTAGEALQRLMRNEELDLIKRQTLIDPLDVVVRRSTSILAVEDQSVAQALNLIRESACKGITVEQVAKSVHISRSLLEKRFRQYVGRSPQVEIRHAQVYRIKELLAETEHSLAQIAEMTGFEHPEYMSVVFKRLTRITPSAYRKKRKGL
ncbi:XylR family transcriptional regulator [Pelagicoccus sp. SDUM812003]|uniref:XylR family transcriptional regulator n=1 Tax=Pelagicoccus sp. SDUM812003 TaxID=3041267 RepID=UPI00280CE9D0|nr:XylR family transcriptional regulator [Pelagicoccus sp. SDUM812003]MDQ8201708.1 XylR family transcriptional regulator [Pelagicoccus sp. SDUM812003]